MPKFDYTPRFDERSKQFPLPVKEFPPRSMKWDCPVWLDQGREGACVGFGVAHLLNSEPLPQLKMTNKFAREEIYWEAQMIDKWAGGSYPGARPRMEGTSVLAGLKVAKRLELISEYRWVFNLSDLIMGLSYHGPAVIGIPWFKGMARPDRKGYIHVKGKRTGGHCILVNGVNVEEEYLTMHNSWGKRWGNKGECKIHFSSIARLINKDAECAFAFGKRAINE